MHINEGKSQTYFGFSYGHLISAVNKRIDFMKGSVPTTVRSMKWFLVCSDL